MHSGTNTEHRIAGTPRRPLLIVLSAPSGAGKSTLCSRLLETETDLAYSISCTTRPPRGGEADGRSYYFMTPGDFERLEREGAFLEQATVHGHRYGTLRKTVTQAIAKGRSVLMDIDVQGARQVREALAKTDPEALISKGFVDIFIHPPSMAVLRTRLEKRAEDGPAVIEERLRNAIQELSEADAYRYQVVNDDLERTLDELRRILRKEWAS